MGAVDRHRIVTEAFLARAHFATLRASHARTCAHKNRESPSPSPWPAVTRPKTAPRAVSARAISPRSRSLTRPRWEAIPIDHIVLVMQENHSFDSYFSALTVPGQHLDGARADATNPDPSDAGAAVSRFHQTTYCIDSPAEEWDQVHREIDGGKLDGFTRENARIDPLRYPQGARSLGYDDPQLALPALADDRARVECNARFPDSDGDGR